MKKGTGKKFAAYVKEQGIISFIALGASIVMLIISFLKH